MDSSGEIVPGVIDDDDLEAFAFLDEVTRSPTAQLAESSETNSSLEPLVVLTEPPVLLSEPTDLPSPLQITAPAILPDEKVKQVTHLAECVMKALAEMRSTNNVTALPPETPNDVDSKTMESGEITSCSEENELKFESHKKRKKSNKYRKTEISRFEYDCFTDIKNENSMIQTTLFSQTTDAFKNTKSQMSKSKFGSREKDLLTKRFDRLEVSSQHSKRLRRKSKIYNPAKKQKITKKRYQNKFSEIKHSTLSTSQMEPSAILKKEIDLNEDFNNPPAPVPDLRGDSDGSSDSMSSVKTVARFQIPSVPYINSDQFILPRSLQEQKIKCDLASADQCHNSPIRSPEPKSPPLIARPEKQSKRKRKHKRKHREFNEPKSLLHESDLLISSRDVKCLAKEDQLVGDSKEILCANETDSLLKTIDLSSLCALLASTSQSSDQNAINLLEISDLPSTTQNGSTSPNIKKPHKAKKAKKAKKKTKEKSESTTVDNNTHPKSSVSVNSRESDKGNKSRSCSPLKKSHKKRTYRSRREVSSSSSVESNLKLSKTIPLCLPNLLRPPVKIKFESEESSPSAAGSPLQSHPGKRGLRSLRKISNASSEPSQQLRKSTSSPRFASLSPRWTSHSTEPMKELSSVSRPVNSSLLTSSCCNDRKIKELGEAITISRSVVCASLKAEHLDLKTIEEIKESVALSKSVMSKLLTSTSLSSESDQERKKSSSSPLIELPPCSPQRESKLDQISNKQSVEIKKSTTLILPKAYRDPSPASGSLSSHSQSISLGKKSGKRSKRKRNRSRVKSFSSRSRSSSKHIRSRSRSCSIRSRSRSKSIRLKSGRKRIRSRSRSTPVRSRPKSTPMRSRSKSRPVWSRSRSKSIRLKSRSKRIRSRSRSSPVRSRSKSKPVRSRSRSKSIRLKSRSKRTRSRSMSSPVRSRSKSKPVRSRSRSKSIRLKSGSKRIRSRSMSSPVRSRSRSTPVRSRSRSKSIRLKSRNKRIRSRSRSSPARSRSKSTPVRSRSRSKSIRLKSRSNRIRSRSKSNRIRSRSKSNRIRSRSKSNRIRSRSKSNRIRSRSRSNRIRSRSKSNRIRSKSRRNRIRSRSRSIRRRSKARAKRSRSQSSRSRKRWRSRTRSGSRRSRSKSSGRNSFDWIYNGPRARGIRSNSRGPEGLKTLPRSRSVVRRIRSRTRSRSFENYKQRPRSRGSRGRRRSSSRNRRSRSRSRLRRTSRPPSILALFEKAKSLSEGNTLGSLLVSKPTLLLQQTGHPNVLPPSAVCNVPPQNNSGYFPQSLDLVPYPFQRVLYESQQSYQPYHYNMALNAQPYSQHQIAENNMHSYSNLPLPNAILAQAGCEPPGTVFQTSGPIPVPPPNIYGPSVPHFPLPVTNYLPYPIPPPQRFNVTLTENVSPLVKQDRIGSERKNLIIEEVDIYEGLTATPSVDKMRPTDTLLDKSSLPDENEAPKSDKNITNKPAVLVSSNRITTKKACRDKITINLLYNKKKETEMLTQIDSSLADITAKDNNIIEKPDTIEKINEPNKLSSRQKLVSNLASETFELQSVKAENDTCSQNLFEVKKSPQKSEVLNTENVVETSISTNSSTTLDILSKLESSVLCLKRSVATQVDFLQMGLRGSEEVFDAPENIQHVALFNALRDILK